jgi:hypothetical protein
VTFSEPLGQAWAPPTTAGELGEAVEEPGAGVVATWAGLEELVELAGEAGGLDEDDDEQPANARVAKQASAAAAHLVRELPNLAITSCLPIPSGLLCPSVIMTTGMVRRLHDDEGAPNGAASGWARELALRRGGSGGWRYHDEGALVGASPVYLAWDTKKPGGRGAGAPPVGRYAAEERALATDRLARGLAPMLVRDK